MVCGLLTIIGFLVWSGYTLVKQNREIAGFTEEAPVEIVPVSVSDEVRAALSAKLQSLQKAIGDNEKAEISLSADELNVMLTFGPFKEVNNLIQIEKIEDGAIHAQISFILNSLPPGTVRYLNGSLSFVPLINDKVGFVLQTEDIRVPGKTVAEGFLRRYKQDGYLDTMLVQEFRDDENKRNLAKELQAINSAMVEGNRVVIGFDPNKKN